MVQLNYLLLLDLKVKYLFFLLIAFWDIGRGLR